MTAVSLQLAPAVLPPDWDTRRAEFGIDDAGRSLVKLSGEIGAVTDRSRAAAARAAGCDWLIGETGAEGLGQRNSSLHNMLRAGLTVRYQRPNWTWPISADGAATSSAA